MLKLMKFVKENVKQKNIISDVFSQKQCKIKITKIKLN